MSQFYNDSVFWIEVDKIKPNPFQPRREFDEEQLKSLADSIRQYGVLQALVVTRKEVPKEDGGLAVEYELIAGERRLRASKMAGLAQVPVLIRAGEDDNLMKLELAIIENVQREDLNPIDRAYAFEKLVKEFGFKHIQIAEKIGKSREYVSNTLRLLALPAEIKQALSEGKITEGHSRPLMMLCDRPEEQAVLFKEILYKKLTVREAESISRKIAYEKIRKVNSSFDPELLDIEDKLEEAFGTRVKIEKKEVGGKITIDFFSNEDLRLILDTVNRRDPKHRTEMLDKYLSKNSGASSDAAAVSSGLEMIPAEIEPSALSTPIDDRTKQEIKEEDNEEIYSVKNFSV